MPLFGREAELKDLSELVDGPAAGCGGVLVQGEPGVGKSALVAEAVAAAALGGLRVLRATGAEAERNFAYAALHQLLRPVRAGADTLPAPQRSALWAALGLAEAGEPNAYLVGLAALTLLSDEAAAKPLLIVAEDVHWMDRESADALAFVARRIETEPIVLIATVRDGEPSPLRDAGLSSMDLGRLPGDVSAELVDSVAPGLSSTARSRVLAEAAGNPLALTELPSAVTEAPEPVLPLTERLERTFGARFAGLPEPARTTSLVAALNEAGSLAETLAAAGSLVGEVLEPSVLAPAVETRLIDLEARVVTFRHPLMRSAIPASVSAEERRRAHLSLAEVFRGQPDRSAWHRAAAATGADEEVARELEHAADRARHRGGATAAVAALEQAALVSADPERRADRLLRAAELAVESGGRETAERLVRDARAGELTPRQRATASWLLSGFEDGVREDLSRIAELARLAESVAEDGQPDPAMRILWGAAMRCFWAEPGEDTRRTLLGVADRLPVEDSDPRLVAVAAYVAPFDRAGSVLRELRELAAATGADPEVDRFLGSASLQIGAVDLAARFSAAAAPGLRAQGRLGLLPRALAVLAWSRVRLGDLAAAVPVAAEAAQFAKETGQPFMYGLATAVQAEIAALRGDHKQAKALAVEAERTALAAGARPVLATVQLAKGIAASSEGRFDDAFADLRRLFDPADPACQPALRVYFIAELAEVAVRAGQVDALREIVAEMEQLALKTPAPALHIGLRFARAVLEPGDELFETALGAELDGWPAERGRLHLAYGEWLRRQRRAVDSRAHLRTARETFDALGMTAWAERARRELRSAGESSPHRGPDAREKLTPHELSIVQLAAEGLTNREIGQRLYLSHRTVGTHLHRIFPKLGVSSRAELKKALGLVSGKDG
ncbi:regulatory protein, luxR family [Amycolatopsis lurida]|uniref:LuxR family transcriptional regulator n=1 Tax=Amycolatopsis lurida NRRL 2430 TaxID=1460371 RepID=A0A2P2FMX3_AMYLU|nr:LuxR family transcriptional regulator [Amycolatopsis lurida]KFU78075.1 LuxR family transcriptional regulator [Amycolatopsis lurida NRRL 2430]SEC33051.1 regulatory protein, luxR family [Amycolatopsis lurida]